MPPDCSGISWKLHYSNWFCCLSARLFMCHLIFDFILSPLRPLFYLSIVVLSVEGGGAIYSFCFQYCSPGSFGLHHCVRVASLSLFNPATASMYFACSGGERDRRNLCAIASNLRSPSHHLFRNATMLKTKKGIKDIDWIVLFCFMRTLCLSFPHSCLLPFPILRSLTLERREVILCELMHSFCSWCRRIWCYLFELFSANFFLFLSPS